MIDFAFAAVQTLIGMFGVLGANFVLIVLFFVFATVFVHMLHFVVTKGIFSIGGDQSD